MFTGIIEEIGKIEKIKKTAISAEITVGACRVLEDVNLGDSIAVNGVCLTVTEFTKSSFTADVMNETWERTALADLQRGNGVNLERALSVNGRLGGHIVSGHIDGTGIIKEIRKDGNSVWYKIKTSEKILRYIIEKGSIAIDGISLTVAKVTATDFSVSIIPHTREQTILKEKKVNDLVNLENDIIGKYVESLFQPERRNKPTGITREFLMKNGF